MKIELCGQIYDVAEEIKDGSITYSTKINDASKTLSLNFAANLHETLKEYQDEIEYELKLDLYCLLKDVFLADLSEGKHPELLHEFVREFGIDEISVDTQAKYSDTISNAMANYGEKK